MSRELNIHIYGSPILTKKTAAVKFIGSDEKVFFEAMADMMYKAKGVGLAANQVGADKQMLVIDVGTGLIKMANPRIIKKQGRCVLEEGCLSLPEVTVKVARAKCVVVTGINEHNQSVKINADDLLARAFQHEVDHLNGKMIIDYAPWYKKRLFKKKLKYHA